MRKTGKRHGRLEKKIFAITLAVVLTIVSISPSNVIFAYGNAVSQIIDATFSEVLSADMQSTNVKLQIVEKDNQEIVSIQMPDGTTIEKNKFQYDKDSNAFVEYTANKNGELSYTVTYREKTEDALSDEESQGADIDENISYEVASIRSFDDMKLTFKAEDMSATVGSSIDVMQGITIYNEDGLNVSDKTSVVVTDYNDFDANKAGSYELVYSAEHPISKKAFLFNRNIVVSEAKQEEAVKNSKESVKENINDTTEVGLALSSGNATLKNPEDFKIGDNSQLKFSINVTYRPNQLDKGRSLKLYIPKNFELERNLYGFTSAYDIVYEDAADGGQYITIKFINGVDITLSTDISLLQKAEALYEAANDGDVDYEFKAEAFSEATSLQTKNFVLHTPKLIDNMQDGQVSIDEMNYQNYTYAANLLAGRGEVYLGNDGNSLVIHKKAMSSLGNLDLQLPLSIGNAAELARGTTTEIYGEDSIEVVVNYEILENGKAISNGKIKLEENGTIFINKEIMDKFMYSYTDRTLKIKSVLRYQWGLQNKNVLHDNPDSFFTSDQEISINNSKKYGFLKVKNEVSGSESFHLSKDYENPFQEVDKSDKLVPKTVYQNTAVIPIEERYARGTVAMFYYKTDVNQGLIEHEYTFPYELQPFGLTTSSNFLYHDTYAEVTITTNRGREVTYGKDYLESVRRNVNDGYLYKFDMSSFEAGEYVNKMIVRRHSSPSSISGYTRNAAFGMAYNVTDHDSSGTPLGSARKVVSVNEKIRTVGKNNETENNYDVNIDGTTSDNYGVSTYGKAGEVYINEVAELGRTLLEIPTNGKSIEKLNVTFDQNKVFNFLESFMITSYNDFDNLIVKYSTNKRLNQELIVTETFPVKVSFPLDEDEYITDLEYTANNIKARSGNKLKGSFQIELYFNPKSNFPSDNSSALNQNYTISQNIDIDGKVINKSFSTAKIITRNRATNIETGTNKNLDKSGNMLELNGSTNLDSMANGNVPTYYPLYKLSRIINAGINWPEAGSQFYLEKGVLDFSNTDKGLLSLVGNISCVFDADVIYSTNKRSDVVLKYKLKEKNGDLSLAADEYLTDIKFENITLNEKQNGSSHYLELVNMYKRKDFPRTLPIDNSYLGDGKTYHLSFTLTGLQDGVTPIELAYDGENGTIISGKQTVDIKSNVIYSSLNNSYYQGEAFKYALPAVQIDASKLNANKGTKNKVTIKNPVYYYAVDGDYSFKSETVKVGNGKADVEFQKGVLKDGSSLLKVTYRGFEETYDVTSTGKLTIPSIEVSALVNANATKGDHNIIKGMAVDINNSLGKNQSEAADLSLSTDAIYDDTTFDFEDFMTSTPKDLLDTKFEVRAQDVHNVLEVREMGVNSLAVKNDTVAISVEGYDNDVYQQQVSITSNFDIKTKDWQVYIPIPKAGQTVSYVGKDGEVHQTDANGFSMILKEEVELADSPAGTKIEYTTDENPKYAYDGSVDASYSESVTGGDYAKVTMIRITIPELGLGERIFPTLTYAYDGKKENIGEQIGFGGNYYNMKLGDASDYYYGTQGGYSIPVDYTIKDFVINGTIWEDKEEPANHVLDATDILKANVTVQAKTENGLTYSVKSKVDGTYELVVPTHGKVEVSVIAPNNTTAKPVQSYTFLNKDEGTDRTSSVVDSKGRKTVTLDHSDIYEINAGMWANRAVQVNTGTVEAKTVMVKKGETAQVPALAFPTYVNITYGAAVDETIATVDANGLVTGNKVGKTTAKVSIPDGNGGTVEDTYDIKVIPAQAPSLDTDSIHIFSSSRPLESVFDLRSGVVVKDGNGEVAEVDFVDRDRDNPKDILVTWDTSSVDMLNPGKYPIIYTVEDGYETVNVTRYVYVYGGVQFTELPEDRTLKIGSTYTPAEGAKASYIGVNEDGTLTDPIDVVVTPTGTAVGPPVIPEIYPIHLRAMAEIEYTDKFGNYYRTSYHTEDQGGIFVTRYITFNDFAKLTVEHDNVMVRVEAEMGEIQASVGAKGSMIIPTALGSTEKQILPVDWSEFDDFDTSIPKNTRTAFISTIDPDTNDVLIEDITVTVAERTTINTPGVVDKVVGEAFDPAENVTIKGGDGNLVTLTPDMIVKNEVPVDSDGKLTTPGTYRVEYKYTDYYGGSATETTTVRVHGKLQFNSDAIHQIEGDNTDSLNDYSEVRKLAWYIDNNGNRREASYRNHTNVESNVVGLSSQTIIFTHPIPMVTLEETLTRNIYTHGKVTITAPTDKTLKVGTVVNPIEGATASYEHVKTDGTIESISVPVTSPQGTSFTSNTPAVKTVTLNATVMMDEGMENTADVVSYKVTFNGLPTITTSKDEITVRVGATEKEIKDILNAKASVHYAKDIDPTDLTDQIVWENLDKVDTSKTNTSYKVTLKVVDADGTEITKEITIKVSNDVIIDLPESNLVVGDVFDPKKDVIIKDGNGNQVVITPDMIVKNDVITDADGKVTKPGNYEVEYTYKDSYGNVGTATNIVKVHGDLESNTSAIHQIEGADVTGLNDPIEVAKLAWYTNSDGLKKAVTLVEQTDVTSSVVGKETQTITFQHPFKTEETKVTRNIYTHGKLIIPTVSNKTVKINENVKIVDGIEASYVYVKENGDKETRKVNVTSDLGNEVTSALPSVKTIPLKASIAMAEGLLNTANNVSYKVTFNGLPKVVTSNDSFTIRVNATQEEIKAIVNAKASVLYGNDATETDLTNEIVWENLDLVDTSNKNGTYEVTLKVTDADGAQATKTITLKISDDIIMNLPEVDKVIGDTFDPFEDVTIFDGNGNKVDPKDVTVDDSKVDMSKPGSYEVDYTYKDELGNEKTETNIVRVNGTLQLEGLDRVDLIVKAGTTYVGSTGKAYYINYEGKRVDVIGTYDKDVNQGVVKKNILNFTAKHPVNNEESTGEQAVYVHGDLKFTYPENGQTSKVDKEVDPTKGVSATYQHVKDDGTIVEKKAKVTGDAVTSSKPGVVNAEVQAKVEIVNGLVNEKTGSVDVVFNGLPVIRTDKDTITIRVGATQQEIKDVLHAQAHVQYGKDDVVTDLTNDIEWIDLDDVNTSIQNGKYEITLKVKDADGAEATKKVTIKISDDIIMNLPDVDKVIGDPFDPFEDVTIIDGSGNKVDPKDVIVDDSKVDMNKPGSYEVDYTYKDELGNEKTETNIVRVNGDLQFEGLDRIDLIEKAKTTYVATTGKAYYIDYEGNRVDVAGAYDNDVDQSIVQKNTLNFTAKHPVNNKQASKEQAVYVHGDIKFQYPENEISSKVNTTIDVTDKVSASYQHVKDDGSIEVKNVPVTGDRVSSDKVGYVPSNIQAKVEVVEGLVNNKEVTIDVAFHGYPYIDAVGSVFFKGEPSKEDVIDAFKASAGMKKADGNVIDLTSSIDYTDLKNVTLNKSGEYVVRITVQDIDGFKTYKDIIVKIEIPEPEKPIDPDKPVDPDKPTEPDKPVDPDKPTEPEKPVDPDQPTTPENPEKPSDPTKPVEPSNPGNSNGDNTGDNGNNKDNTTNDQTPTNPDTTEDKKKEDVITVITKDIPLSKAKEKEIDDEFVKSYITATSKTTGNKNFTILDHNVKAKVGTYEVTIRFDDGSEQTVSINVVDDAMRDVQQPEFGKDDECFIHWFMLLFLLGYSGYSITLIMKRRKDNERLDEVLRESEEQNTRGGK